MNVTRVSLASVGLIVAILLQTTIFARLPLPGGTPNVIVVFVIAIALAAGASAGLACGFAAGLASDLLSDHPVGVLTLCFVLLGFTVGLVANNDEDVRGVLRPLGISAIALTATYLLAAGIFKIVGGDLVMRDIPTAVLYDLMLTPFVVPFIGLASRVVAVRPRF